MLFESDCLQLQISYGMAELRFRAPTTWREVVADLNLALDIVVQQPNIGVVTLRALDSLPIRDDVCATCRDGQRLTERIAGLPFPTVAHADGLCRGPALELVLACSWRTASGQIGTRFGAQGMACWGGTVRLPRLVGRTSALALLAGTAILNVRQAYDIGLIDRMWAPRFAEVGLLGLSLDLQNRPRGPSNHIRRWRAASLPAPSVVPNWLVRAVDRGLKFGSEEALVVERAAALAFLKNQCPGLRHAA